MSNYEDRCADHRRERVSISYPVVPRKWVPGNKKHREVRTPRPRSRCVKVLGTGAEPSALLFVFYALDTIIRIAPCYALSKTFSFWAKDAPSNQHPIGLNPNKVSAYQTFRSEIAYSRFGVRSIYQVYCNQYITICEFIIVLAKRAIDVRTLIIRSLRPRESLVHDETTPCPDRNWCLARK